MIRIVMVAAATVMFGCAPREAPAPTLTSEQPPAAESQQPCVIPPKGEPRMCTQQYEPVCGCNGRTYGNACVATAQGVQRFTPGRCEDPPEAEHP